MHMQVVTGGRRKGIPECHAEALLESVRLLRHPTFMHGQCTTDAVLIFLPARFENGSQFLLGQSVEDLGAPDGIRVFCQNLAEHMGM